MKTFHVLMNLNHPLRSNRHRVDEAVLGVTVQAENESDARVTARLQTYALGDKDWTLTVIEEEK